MRCLFISIMNKSFFIVPYVVYPFDLMVSFGHTDFEIERLLKKYNIQYEGADWQMAEFGTGKCTMFTSGQTLLRLPQKPFTNEEYGTLQHEIFHAAEFLFTRIGLTHSISCGEAYAYLIGYITKEIYKNL